MTHSGTTRPVSRISGNEMPSMPTMKRELMTSIHLWLTRNCMSPLWSKSNAAARPMVVAKTNTDVSSATHLCSCSSALGMIIITAAPISGANTATLGPQCLRMSSICGRSLLESEDEYARKHDGSAEQERAVLLDLAGLEATQELAGSLGAGP